MESWSLDAHRFILPFMKALVIGVVIVVAAVAAWLSSGRKRKRRLGLASFSEKFGFRYTAYDSFNLLWDYNFPLFEMGDGRGTENVVAGTWKGMPFRETDYWYYTKGSNGSDDKTKSYKHFNAVVIDIPAYLPTLTIERESIATRIADEIGFRDFQFESDEFNRAFRIRSEDRAFAFKLIDARMMHWLLSTNRRFAFQFKASGLLVYSTKLRPAELLPLIGTGKELYDHIPRLVWSDYGTDPSQSSEAGR